MNPMPIEAPTLLRLHDTMVRIRVFEQRAEQLFLEKKIPLGMPLPSEAVWFTLSQR